MNFRTLSSVALVSLALASCSSSRNGTVPTPQSSSSSSYATQNADVIVETPVADSLVKSPLVVRGKARGTWFFEGSLPVQVQDSKGTVLVTTPAQAAGEWMTTDFVDFAVRLTFKTNDDSGFVVIKKDNPSGLPENDAEVKIPVKF